MTQTQVAKAKLTPKIKDAIKADPQFKNLLTCIDRTWQVIGYETMQAIAESGEKPLKKAERLETTLDANYISTNCGNEGKAAEAYLQELEKQYDYKAVAKFLLGEVFI